MKITRDVILDLWPVYESGEASPATRALVEEYLRDDVDLARMLREQEPRIAALQAELPPDLHVRTLERTKKMIRLRSWLFALGIWFAWASFFVAFWDFERGGRVVRGTFFMWRDRPDIAGVCLVASACCWVAYYRLRRRLRATRL